jgi:hypothetical protein
MRVMQSDLFEQLDDAERAECDALVRANPYMNFRSNADSAPAPAVEAGELDERAAFEAFVSETVVLSTECDAHGFYKDPVVYEWWIGWQARAALARASEAPANTDDIAVDSFARAMKDKMAQARAKGRSGWEGCEPDDLSRMLREHVEKGDPRDVANFCMMLWHHSASIARASEAATGETCGACNGSGRVPRDPDIGTDQECFVCEGSGCFIDAAPQPASEQQPVPQLFADTGDAVRGTFGKTVFAEMSNSDDLWSVWLDGWLRAIVQQDEMSIYGMKVVVDPTMPPNEIKTVFPGEQQAARGLSDDVRSRLEFYAACYCKSTSATDREAGKAMYALLAAKGDGQ